MSLRRRLWLVLAGLFLVPVVVGALVLLLVVPDAQTGRVTERVAASADGVRAELANECAALRAAGELALVYADSRTPQDAVDRLAGAKYADYAAVYDDSGERLAEAGRLPPGSGSATRLPSCTDGAAETSSPVVAEQVNGSDPQGGDLTVVVAKRLGGEMQRDLRVRARAGDEIVLLAGRDVVYTTAGSANTRALVRGTRDHGSGPVDVGDWTARADPPSAGVPWTTVVAAPNPGGTTTRIGLFALILLTGALVAGALVSVVARNLSQPYVEITEAAERVAGGDLEASVRPAADGEAGRLGSAFNAMTGELRRSTQALERSRDDLRDSLERIGDTLSSTHDLDGLLQVVLETASVTLQARAGVVLHLSADRLHLVAEHGLHEAGLPAPAVVSPGNGVLGRVLATGEGVRGRLGSGPPELAPASDEPARGDILAVPLRSMGNVVGVVALYDRTDGRPFDATDEDALRTLAGQASIAVDNVHLHNEAQRLSTTDPLTGLWNFRYLSMSLAREIERSTRFDRPLAVLMLDLDHFKSVNDAYGHARGDAVLRELAHRVQEQIREVDTFARYGGEEFVVVLPETTVDGAAQLAERICVAVRREPFRQDGEDPLEITVSVGGAAFPDHGSTPATLMRSADQALYVAKGAGRDQWHVPGADHASHQVGR